MKKSRIRETPTLSTDADSRTATIFEKLRDLLYFFRGKHSGMLRKCGDLIGKYGGVLGKYGGNLCNYVDI